MHASVSGSTTFVIQRWAASASQASMVSIGSQHDKMKGPSSFSQLPVPRYRTYSVPGLNYRVLVYATFMMSVFSVSAPSCIVQSSFPFVLCPSCFVPVPNFISESPATYLPYLVPGLRICILSDLPFFSRIQILLWLCKVV